jgi:hypothetical protein
MTEWRVMIKFAWRKVIIREEPDLRFWGMT